MFVSKTDQSVIDLLQERDALTVEEMMEVLGVTATAIRQRLTRLLAGEYIERFRASEGRGRPKHRYSLTKKGRRTAGNNLEDLAISLWEEVQLIEDESVKRKVIEGVTARLARKFEADGATVDERMRSVSAKFAERKIPISFSTSEQGLPIVEVNGCPYPEIAGDDKQICNLEKEVLTRVVGTPVELCRCRKDGDPSCSFEATSLSPAAEKDGVVEST